MSEHTDPTPALLPPARLAEIRERVAAGKFEHTMSDRAALLAHLDATQAPAPEDGGRELARRAEAFAKYHDDHARGAGHEFHARAATFLRNVPTLHAHGYARGVAAGEAERGQLQAIIDGEREGYQALLAKRDAELAEVKHRAKASAEERSFEIEEADRAFALATNRALRAEAERDALAKRLDLGPAEVVTLAAWGEEKAKSARLVAELAEARGIEINLRESCRIFTLNCEERDAEVARLQSALAESQESAKRWISLAERNGDDARAHGAERERLKAELDTWREVTGADTPHQLSAELAIARAKRRGATERRRG